MTIAIPLIPVDKANHAIDGALVFIIAAIIPRLLGYPEWSLVSAWCANVSVALGKELYDWLSNRAAIAKGLPPPHGVELLDAFATITGAVMCDTAAKVI